MVDMKFRTLVNLVAIVVAIAVLSMADAGSMTPNSVIEAQSVCENSVAVPDPTNNPGLVSDCEALLAARDTLADSGSLDWADNTPIVEWEGITVGGTPERVTELYLRGGKINGEISPELGNLTGLKSLRLVIVPLRGGIPSELGNISSLERLELLSLSTFGLGGLSGAIPAELGNLSNLRRLAIGGTQLSGELPPELGSLTNLEHLILAANHLSGELPASFTGLTKLELLNFVYNSGICAPIEEDFQEWLDGVDLVRGSSCATVDFADDRAVLMAFRNGIGGGRSRLTDWGSNKLMREWIGVTTDADGRVNWLELNSFSLQGRLSSRLGELAELDGLGLERNSFSGGIPTTLGSLTNLRFLGLFDNQLTGEIPSGLSELSNLRALSLEANRLTGEIPPELGNLSNLQSLSLGANQLTGEIPPELGNLSNLQSLSLRPNQLTGEIPPELGNLSNLRALSLGANRLTGEIPPELGNLSNLQSLSLRANQLTGEIPPELGNLSSLGQLDLATNELTGEIPSEFGNLSELRLLYLSGNQLTGCIPYQLEEVRDNDFDQLGLPFCEVLSPGNPSVSIGITDGYLVRINSPIFVTATFSAPVTGFTLGDITVSNGEASNFAGGDGDSVYTFDVTPDAISVVAVDVGDGVAQDADGDGNIAAVQLSLGLPYDDDDDGKIGLDLRRSPP